ncbi:MAG: DUF2180 family protein [Planctomycetota bacterium]|jgi:hypothetical protein
MKGSCKICDRFFGRTREAVGVCTSCGSGFCEEHGIASAGREEGACLFCADEFGSRVELLGDEN